jgi:putative flavoprotein involved in K+ transport
VNKSHETIIVGGSQAGLSVGYHLQRRGRPFLILEATNQVGDAWRSRWDSLCLFTPAKMDGLDGMRFPAAANHKPTKDEMADYLKAYAAHFRLPVRTGVRVSRICKHDGRFLIEAGEKQFDTDNVVVATGSCRVPRLPPYARQLDPGIAQLHSSQYRNPSQLRPGPVLIVGVGNSGAEISVEVAGTHPTWLAGKERGHVPFNIDGFTARFLVHGVRFAEHHVLSRGNPIGRRITPTLVAHGKPLVRVKPKQILSAGIRRVPRVTEVRDALPLLEDGRTLDVRTVVWCTGFRLDFSWIDLPVFDAAGVPRHERGIIPHEPGLAFVGLPFQYAATSELVPGIGRDAAYVARHIAARAASRSGGTAAAAASPQRSVSRQTDLVNGRRNSS